MLSCPLLFQFGGHMATFKYDNVNELYSDIQTYVDRNESTFTNMIPSWVFQAENELDRRLRHPAAEVISTYKVLAGKNSIPSPMELLELKSIRSRTTNQIIFKRSYEVLYDVVNNTRYPIAFASVANNYYLDKVADEDVVYEFIFYTSPPKLGTDNPTNFYLSMVPDFLLYVSLESAFIFDGQPDQAQYWRQMAEAQLALLNEQIKRESYQGSTLIAYGDSERNNFYY